MIGLYCSVVNYWAFEVHELVLGSPLYKVRYALGDFAQRVAMDYDTLYESF